MASTLSVSRVETVQLVEALLNQKLLSPAEYEGLITFAHLDVPADHFLLESKDELESCSKIFKNSTCLEDKAIIVCQVNKIRGKIERSQIEINTYNWLQIGRMLIVLNNDLLNSSEDIGWCKWVKANIPICKKRVDQAIKLAHIGPALEKYYFLGIDNLINFVMRLMAYGKTARFSEASKLVGFKHTFEKLTPEEQEIVRKQIAKINKMDFFNSDVDMMLDRAEKVGVKNMDKPRKLLREIKQEDMKIKYLTKLITNRGQGMNLKEVLAEDAHKRESMISILCKFQESVNKNIKEGSSPYPPMRIELVESSIVLMNLLKELMDNNKKMFSGIARSILS